MQCSPDDGSDTRLPQATTDAPPLGSAAALPVVADERIAGQAISIGAGAHGVAATVAADDLIAGLDASVADVTDPATPGTVRS